MRKTLFDQGNCCHHIKIEIFQNAEIKTFAFFASLVVDDPIGCRLSALHTIRLALLRALSSPKTGHITSSVTVTASQPEINNLLWKIKGIHFRIGFITSWASRYETISGNGSFLLLKQVEKKAWFRRIGFNAELWNCEVFSHYNLLFLRPCQNNITFIFTKWLDSYREYLRSFG